MASPEFGTFIRLKDTDETVAEPGDDIRGHRVLDKDGNKLGKVDALLIDDTEKKVRFLEVSTGGFLGIGAEKSLIPVDAITHVEKDTVHLDRTGDTVAGSPAYDPELEVVDTSFYASTYGYYGVMPFWGAGYAYPQWSGGAAGSARWL